MIKLYQYEISPFCTKVRRALHFKGLEYTTEEMTPRRILTELGRLNRRKKLPCIRHEDRVVCDSTDIIEYLQELQPEPSLVPETPEARALDRIFEDWGDEVLYFFEMYFRFKVDANWPGAWAMLAGKWAGWERLMARPMVRRQIVARVDAQGLGGKPYEVVCKEYRSSLQSLEDLLSDGRRFLTGEQLGAGDLSVASMSHCIKPLPEGAIWQEFPQASAWLQRVDGLTAWPFASHP